MFESDAAPEIQKEFHAGCNLQTLEGRLTWDVYNDSPGRTIDQAKAFVSRIKLRPEFSGLPWQEEGTGDINDNYMQVFNRANVVLADACHQVVLKAFVEGDDEDPNAIYQDNYFEAQQEKFWNSVLDTVAPLKTKTIGMAATTSTGPLQIEGQWMAVNE